MPSIKSKEGSSSYQTFDENDLKFDKHHLNRFIDDNITPSIGSVLDTSLIDKDKGFLSFLGSDVSKISFRMNILKRDFTMLDYYNSEELEPYLNMETYIKHLYSIISECSNFDIDESMSLSKSLFREYIIFDYEGHHHRLETGSPIPHITSVDKSKLHLDSSMVLEI